MELNRQLSHKAYHHHDDDRLWLRIVDEHGMEWDEDYYAEGWELVHDMIFGGTYYRNRKGDVVGVMV